MRVLPLAGGASAPPRALTDEACFAPAASVDAYCTSPHHQLNDCRPSLPPTHPAPTRPRTSKINAREAELLDAHNKSKLTVQGMFVAAVPPDQRFIINTVSPNEGIFLAEYLGVPQANVLKLVMKNAKVGSSTSAKIMAHVRHFIETHRIDGGSITLLGHMIYDKQDERKFAHHLSPDRVHTLLRGTKPAHLNFVSCNSATFSAEVAALFAADGFVIAHRAYVQDYEELSQWRKRNGLRMYYGGPEIGYLHKTFGNEHVPACAVLRVTHAREAEGCDSDESRISNC